MKIHALLLLAVTSVFIGCSEPGDPVVLGEVDLSPSLKKDKVDLPQRDENGQFVLDEDNKALIVEDTTVKVIPVPFYVDHFFLAEGWMGAYDDGIFINKNCPAAKTSNGGYIEEERFKGTYTPNFDLCRKWKFTPNFEEGVEDRKTWGGVAWLQQTNWGDRAEDLVRVEGGVTVVSFWAKSARNEITLYNDTNDSRGNWFKEKKEGATKCKRHNHRVQVALCTDKKEACDWNPENLQFVISLTDKWTYYELPIPESQSFVKFAGIVDGQQKFDTTYVLKQEDPHKISSAFIWTNAKNDVPGDDPLEFYLDRIRYSTREVIEEVDGEQVIDDEYFVKMTNTEFATLRSTENENAKLLEDIDDEENCTDEE
jgi:hypothetical protein